MYVLSVFRGNIQTHMHSAYDVHMYTPKFICLYESVLYVYVCMFKIIHFGYGQIQQIHTHAYTYIPYILYIPIHTIHSIHTDTYHTCNTFNTYRYIHIYCRYTHMHTHTVLYLCLCACIVHISGCTCMYDNVCACICMYVHVCVCMCFLAP